MFVKSHFKIRIALRVYFELEKGVNDYHELDCLHHRPLAALVGPSELRGRQFRLLRALARDIATLGFALLRLTFRHFGLASR